MSELRKGHKVMWRGSFGKDKPVEAVVNSIEKCEDGCKEGREVSSVDWSDVDSRNYVIDLDNGHWCYGTQITEIPQ